jgi:hypothetical protein
VLNNNAARDSLTGVASLACRQAVRPHRKSHYISVRKLRVRGGSYAEPTFVIVWDNEARVG